MLPRKPRFEGHDRDGAPLRTGDPVVLADGTQGQVSYSAGVITPGILLIRTPGDRFCSAHPEEEVQLRPRDADGRENNQ